MYYTDSDIRDNLIKARVISCINDFENFIRTRSIQLSDRVNVVFSIRQNVDDPAKYACDYYMVDHSTHLVFWLDRFDAAWLPGWPEVRGVNSLMHIGRIEIVYFLPSCSKPL